MPAEIKCQVCGRVFVGRASQKYCGKACWKKSKSQVTKEEDEKYLASAKAAVAACDEETTNRLMSIFMTRRYASKMKKRWVQSGPPFKGRTCGVCGKTFDANSASQKYCGQECYESAKQKKEPTLTDRHTEVAKIAVGALTDETRARLAAILEGVA